MDGGLRDNQHGGQRQPILPSDPHDLACFCPSLLLLILVPSLRMRYTRHRNSQIFKFAAYAYTYT